MRAGRSVGLARLDGTALLVDDQVVDADAVVFAAGPWLPKPGPVSGLDITVPQQEVIFLATPPGDARFDAGSLPTWVEYDAAFYGLPAIEGRGSRSRRTGRDRSSTPMRRNAASPTSGSPSRATISGDGCRPSRIVRWRRVESASTS